MSTETIKIPTLHTRAEFNLSTVNDENRTVEVVWTTGARGKRFDWRREEYYIEELGMDPANIRMDFLNSGRAPVLDNHDSYTGMDSVIGRVVEGSIKIEGGQGRALLQYDTDERGDKAWGKIKRGFATNISVGYKIHRMERVEDAEEGGKSYRVLRAVDWEPMEISNVPIPFDKGAHTRSEEALYEVEVKGLESRQDENFEEEQDTQTRQQAETKNRVEDTMPKANTPETTPETEVVDTEKVRAEAITAERQRTAAIMEAVRKARLDEAFGMELVEKGVSVDEARAQIIDKFVQEDPAKGQRGVNVKVTTDETETFRRAVSDAIILRSNPGMKLAESEAENRDRTEAARAYRGFRLLDVAKETLERQGENVRGLDQMEIAGRAITSSTGDFPVIMANTINRVLLANYTNASDTWRRFCNVGSVSDFREHERLRLGSLSRLDKVLETGEFKNKSISDAEKEVIRAFEYGNLINLSRTAIINDSLDAFGRLPAMLGRAAARSIEIDVYGLFALNSGNGPTMVDGNPLFHASHNNIGSGSALSVEGIDADRVLLAQQKDKDDNDFLDLRPSVLLVPIGLGGNARVINDAQYDPDTANKLQKPNKVRGLFDDIVDTPRLSGTTRYLLADPSIEPVFEVAFLNGNQTPYLESQEAFSQSGIQWKIRLDYGVGAIGYRGIVKNAGA